MADLKSKMENNPVFLPYPQGTNLLGYDSNGLPIELVVTAPRKYVTRYDINGNPVYTYDRNLSMGYTTPPLTEEEKRRKAARTEIKNRRPTAMATLSAIAKAEIGGRTMDLATRTFTPYSSWSDGIGQLAQTAMGWNPNDNPLGRILTDLTNPGYWNPYGVTEKLVNTVGNKVLFPIEDAVSTAIDNGTIWDPYTTFMGRFGNYSDNLLINMYASWARRFGLPDKARIPADAMRKITEPVRIDEGRH